MHFSGFERSKISVSGKQSIKKFFKNYIILRK